jgi:putative PIN family toxin of toxin-antitoxin system
VKVVLDSSVLIAATISRAGVCAGLLEDVLTHHELILSNFIADELARKLREKFKFPDKEIQQLRKFLLKTATIVEPAELPLNACRDVNDVPILGTAVSGAAKLLITVDKDLLAVRTYQGIRVIKPGEFWNKTT